MRHPEPDRGPDRGPAEPDQAPDPGSEEPNPGKEFAIKIKAKLITKTGDIDLAVEPGLIEG